MEVEQESDVDGCCGVSHARAVGKYIVNRFSLTSDSQITTIINFVFIHQLNSVQQTNVFIVQ
jgi:hypothetical protein